jgi:ADP-ribosyl-[dinitrogen reductase] hydrolase
MLADWSENWSEYLMSVELVIVAKIQRHAEKLEKRSQHYNRLIVEPLNDYVLIPVYWLKTNRDWDLVRQEIPKKFSDYVFSFSEIAARKHEIPEHGKVQELSKHFWITIKERRQENRNPSQGVVGCIIGQAVGDALGARYQFSTGLAASKAVQRDTSQQLQMLGGGPFNLLPGQVTDTTEITLVVLRTIQESRLIAVEQLQTRIQQQLAVWTRSSPFNIPDGIAKKDPNLKTGVGLLLAIPIALIGSLPIHQEYVFLDQELVMYAKRICEQFTPNEICIDAVRVYTLALRQILRKEDPEQVWTSVYQIAKTAAIKTCLEDAKKGLLKINLDGVRIIDPDSVTSQDYIGISLQLAIGELLHGKSFVDSINKVISLGGNTAVNGAIVGALLGAWYGISNIPRQWADQVIRYTPRSKDCEILKQEQMISDALAIAKRDQ